MRSSCIYDIQKSVFEILSTDGPLNKTLNGFYDGIADPDANYPYGVLGEFTEVPDDILSVTGRQATSMIHIWSNYHGRKESVVAGARILELLHRTQLAMEDWILISITLDSNQSLMDTAEIRHQMIRMRYKVRAKR